MFSFFLAFHDDKTLTTDRKSGAKKYKKYINLIILQFLNSGFSFIWKSNSKAKWIQNQKSIKQHRKHNSKEFEGVLGFLGVGNMGVSVVFVGGRNEWIEEIVRGG